MEKPGKIGIVSCYTQKNYGSVLQALATQMVLDKLGYLDETINISKIADEIKKEKIKYFIKASLTSDILISKYGMAKNVLIKKFLKTDYTNNARIRDRKIHRFVEEKFNLSDSYSSIYELAKKTKENYSTVLVGSDQLWLPGNIAADYYTLNWVENSINTVAYATSFGQSVLPPKTIKEAKVFLRKIRHISVREESGQMLVNSISGRKVPIVCDPTLLFTDKEWLEIQIEEPLIKEPYIFAYFLGNNPSHREFVKKLKGQTGLKIVALINLDEYIRSDEKYVDYAPYAIDPGDFINLIRNATFVCTDSYHCVIFSIQYERTFFAFKRYTLKTNISTNSRLDTLFKMLGVRNDIVCGDEDVRKCIKRNIDYIEIKEKLKIFRDKSYEYLNASILDERDTDL